MQRARGEMTGFNVFLFFLFRMRKRAEGAPTARFVLGQICEAEGKRGANGMETESLRQSSEQVGQPGGERN